MQRHAVRLTTTLGMVAALSASVVMTAGSAQAVGVQVTRAEYKKVEKGMTPRRVRNIVDSKGTISSGGTDQSCYVRQYTGWNEQTVYFRFDDDNGFHLTDKARLGPLGGIPPLCPGIS